MLTVIEKVLLLQDLDLFQYAYTEHLGQFASICRESELSQDTILFREGEKLHVLGADTLSGSSVDIQCDLVVLGMAMMPAPGIKELAAKLGVETDEFGFITEVHQKLRPLETSVPGIFVCGTAQGPKDIPDSVSQGGAAASKVLRLFSQDELILEKVAVG